MIEILNRFKTYKLLQFLKIISREWFFTTNHKKLGLGYIFFSIWSGLFGTFLSILIRIELSQPQSILFNGHANLYHTVVAVHGLIMVFFLVTPVVFGGFGNYFLPIQVGARDVAYPRLNSFSLWTLPAGLIIMLRTLWEGTSIGLPNAITEATQNSLKWTYDIMLENIFVGYANLSDLGALEQIKKKNDLNSWINIFEKNTSNDLARWISIKNESLNYLLPTTLKGSNLIASMAGWTFTTPLSHSKFTGSPVDWAFAGLAIATITSILTLINLIVTWRYLKGRGSRYQKEFYPIFLISLLLSLRMLIIVSPILNAGLFMLMADRHFFTAFFTVRAGGDILLFQHLFWFFGHPEVYILIMPAFGIINTLIPYYLRKPLVSKMHMVYAMHAIASMGFVVWGHHMYLVGIDNKARILFFVITILIALPASVKVCGWIASLVNSTTFVHVELLFCISFISLFLIGGLSGSFCAHAGLDIMLHDTYYIIGHFHVMLSGCLMGALFAYIYFNIKEFTGLLYPPVLALLHMTLHTIGHIITFLPMLWLGFAGMPRRVQDYPWSYAGWQSISSAGHTIVLISILIFFFTISCTIYHKKPVSTKTVGFPFLSTRLIYLTVDKHKSRAAIYKIGISGKKKTRTFLQPGNYLII